MFAFHVLFRLRSMPCGNGPCTVGRISQGDGQNLRPPAIGFVQHIALRKKNSAIERGGHPEIHDKCTYLVDIIYIYIYIYIIYIYIYVHRGVYIRRLCVYIYIYYMCIYIYIYICILDISYINSSIYINIYVCVRARTLWININWNVISELRDGLSTLAT